MNVLIVDDEDGIREILSFFVDEMSGGKAKVFLADSGNKAVEVIKTESIDLCICDHNMPDGMGPVVLKYIIDKKLTVKFILCSTVVPADDPVSYPAENIFSNIQKPEIYQGMEKIFHQLMREISARKEDLEIPSSEFLPVTTDFLALLIFTPADVYLKLSDKKTVKCFNKTDIFDHSEKEKYHAKGIHTLYLNTEGNRGIILKTIEKRISEILAGAELPLSDRLSLTHHQICEMVKLDGITAELELMIKDTIVQTARIIEANQRLAELWQRLETVGEYPGQLYSLQIMIASLILKRLSWNNEATFIKVGLAVFLQDITLDSLELIKIRDYPHYFKVKETLSAADQKKFLDHPQAASELVAKFSEIPPDVDRIVLEQHEMPNGTGFPRMISATNTGPLSCLFIISGLAARELLEKKADFHKTDFLKELQSAGYNKGNYKEIYDVMLIIFPN